MVRKEIIYVTKEDIQMPGLWVRDRSITCGSFGKCLRFPVTKKESFESLRLPLDKISCTRQFESEFSLHSLASLFPIKEGSTFLTKPLFPQRREDVTALRCSEPLRSKVGGASMPSPCCAGWDRLIITSDIHNQDFLYPSFQL